MNRSLLLSLLALGLLFVTGCKGEATYPNGCGDNADNDEDGYFDCADQDCDAAPACSGQNVRRVSSANEFTAELIALVCQHDADCWGEYSSYEACVDSGGNTDDGDKEQLMGSCGAFDIESANGCLDEVEALSCSDQVTNRAESSALFPSCALVCGNSTPDGIGHPLGY